MYKGCTRDTQGINRLATPEQYRSNILSLGLCLTFAQEQFHLAKTSHESAHNA